MENQCNQLITTVYNKEGDWEPVLDDTCVELSGMYQFSPFRSDVETKGSTGIN